MGRSRIRQALQGRVALITGASSGIGRAIALGYATAGADLILVARRVRPLVQVTQQIQAMGRRALLVVADVSQERAIKRVLTQANIGFPRIDILVNNAGIILPEQPVHETPTGDWDHVLDVNLRGPYLLSRFLAPRMVDAGYGRIINVTSSYKAQPHHGTYSVSKAALWALTQVMAKELKGTGVLVNALDPGWVRTEMAPDGRAEPESVVPMAVRLASLPTRGPSGKEFCLPIPRPRRST